MLKPVRHRHAGLQALALALSDRRFRGPVERQVFEHLAHQTRLGGAAKIDPGRQLIVLLQLDQQRLYFSVGGGSGKKTQTWRQLGRRCGQTQRLLRLRQIKPIGRVRLRLGAEPKPPGIVGDEALADIHLGGRKRVGRGRRKQHGAHEFILGR